MLDALIQTSQYKSIRINTTLRAGRIRTPGFNPAIGEVLYLNTSVHIDCNRRHDVVYQQTTTFSDVDINSHDSTKSHTVQTMLIYSRQMDRQIYMFSGPFSPDAPKPLLTFIIRNIFIRSC
jgi:hypothetical protein